jgi:ketosteroid isomerase-like protein
MRENAAQASKRRLAEELYELFNERDLDALLDRAAPDIEWDWSRSIGPDGGVQRGPAAVGRFIRAQWEHWDAIEMTPEEIVEAGDDVVVFVHVRLRGRDGIEVEARGPHVQTWSGGRLVRYRLFQAREEALAAVGL